MTMMMTMTMLMMMMMIRDAYGVITYPRNGFLRSGSIKPHRSVRYVAADIGSVTIRDFSQKRISDPIRSAP